MKAIGQINFGHFKGMRREPPEEQHQEEETEITEEKKIDELVTKTSRVLFKTSGIFPFDFFPDELTIDENKVNIISRGLIDENIFSIQIKDLADVSVQSVLIFASITISDLRIGHDPITVKWLDPDEAVKAKNILQGLILGREQNIDWAKIKTDELVKKVEELGQVKL